tara:strand:+ start:1560 stop:2444 length:885 start_codon:yes stop_codon:yes gene_type:complete
MKKCIFLIITAALFFLFEKDIDAKDHMEVLWETEKVFELPESVIFDKENSVLYVSSITDHPFKKDGTGYISKVDLDGNVISLKWIKNLNAPKGLTISNNKLYIADVDELVEVDIASEKITNKYKGYGSVCMNDVTHDKYGNVYVGDTYTDTIYRLNQFGQLPVWYYSPQLAPNGLHIDDEDGNLIVASWGGVMEGWGTPELQGSLKSINIHSKKLKNLGSKQIGNLDGIESDGKGAYYVTDWSGAKLYKIKKNGSFKVLKELSKGAADHEVILDKNMIIVPIMTEGKLVALKIK